MISENFLEAPVGCFHPIRWNDFRSSMLIPMLSRAQWYRDQAALALQRGHETRDPTLRAGFDELGREWLRLAEQVEWIENQQRPPRARSTSRRNRTG
jgi:hypothetical protein